MLLLWVLASVLVTVAHGDTTQNGSSNLRIHIPHNLFKEEGYDHRVALFGVPAYGGSLALTVYYADSDLCDSHVNATRGYPSRATDENGNMFPWPAPYILMVDRGGCTFVKKVRNAQHAGAAAVVIADNVCLCSDAQCMQDTNAAMCETAEPVMADDGSGSDVSIPSFFMFKVDADAVKAELEQDQPVLMELSWSLPRTRDRVEYELWTLPTNLQSRDFLTHFKTIAEALGRRAYFTPHNYIHDGVLLHCLGDNGEMPCYNLCTNHGRYCATDPDTDMERGISGADVVRESLRRSCIWKSYGEADGVGTIWWDYMFEFTARCSTPDYFANEDCIDDVYEHAGVDSTKILRCMQDSGGLDSDGANALLDMEIYARSYRGVVVIPTVFVNEVPIRDHLSVSTVFSAICAGFALGTAPDVCVTCATCHDLIDCVIEGQCRLDANDGAESQSFSSEEGDSAAERNNDLLKNDTSAVLESEDSA